MHGWTAVPRGPDLSAHYALAYDEARRALDAQKIAVSDLQSRAAALIAAAAVTTSFFGGRALAIGDIDAWAWTAITISALLSTTVLSMLWPRRDWVFTINASKLLESYVERDEGPLSVPQIHRNLAVHMSRRYQLNVVQLRWLTMSFRASAVLLVAETVTWMVDLSIGT